MAHEVMGTISGGYRYLGRHVPPWWAIDGYVIEGEISAEDALKQIDNDDPIVIDKLPYGVDVPGYGMFNPDNRFVIVRRPTHDSPNPVVFAEVGPQYEVLQNWQIAQLADMLIDGTAKTKNRWTLDTIGILKEGRTIFIGMKGDNFIVAGDDHMLYFAVSDQRDGTEGIDFIATGTRIVCQNTFSFALKNNNNRITMRHHSDVFSEASWRINMIANLISAGNSMISALRTLESIVVTDKRFDTILTELFPLPRAPRTIELRASNVPELVSRGDVAAYQYENRTKQVKRAREQTKLNFENLAEKYDRTGYAAFNAITEYIDHQSSKATSNGVRVAAERTLSAEMDKLRGKAVALIMKSK